MNETSPPNARRAALTARQAGAVALTGVIALTASAALAWSLRAWRERPEPPPGNPTASPASATSADSHRQAVVLGAGRLAYQVHCARCHGAGGHGDGPDAERLVPPPRDFASDHWRLAPTPESVRQVIVSGIPGTAMPGWGAGLSPRELDGLVAHVLSLGPPKREARRENVAEPPPLPRALVSSLSRAGFSAEATPRPAPALTVRDLDGNTCSLAEHRDRPVLLLFWGTTCGHCLAELPDVAQFAERHRNAGRGFDVLPVCVDETDAAVIRTVVGPTPTRQPVYCDPSAMAQHYFDVQTLPGLVLIDRSGRIIARASGTRDWRSPALDELIDQFVAIAPGAEPARPTLGQGEGNATRPDHRPG